MLVIITLVNQVSLQITTDVLVRQKQSEALEIARNLNQQLYTRFLAASNNTSLPLETLQNASELDTFIKERTYGLSVEKVNIFDPRGRVIYSTDSLTDGLHDEELIGFSSAMGGITWSALDRHHMIRGVDGVAVALDVVEVYVPLQSLRADSSHAVVGVFEIYLNVSDALNAQVTAVQQPAMLTTVGLMALMFCVLTVIAAHADRVMRHSHAQLMAREGDLLQLGTENARLYHMAHSRRLDEQNVLLNFSRSLLRTHDPHSVLDETVRTTIELLPVNCATVWLPHGDRGCVQLVAVRGWTLPLTEPFIEHNASLPSLVMRRRQALEMANLLGERGFSFGANLSRLKFRSALGVPLLLGERALGALVVFRHQPKPFDGDEMRLLTLLANQTALALDQARLYQETLERERFAASLTRLGIAINATLNLQAVLDIICIEATNSFDVTTSLIWRMVGDELVCVSAHGIGSNLLLGMKQPTHDPILVGARVIRERKPSFVNFAAGSPQVKQSLLDILQGKAIMGVPFFKGEQPVGSMILIDSVRADRFTDEDISRAIVFGQQAAIAIHNAQLYEQTEQQAQELSDALTKLEGTYDATLAALSAALDARDRETEGHSLRVAAYTLELARTLGVPHELWEAMERGALLHDIGKIGVPDSVLRKPGALNADEWDLMREHPRLGEQMLRQISFLANALAIVSAHQERWDGLGYPHGLRGDEIPLGARIFAVADTLDALLSERPYRHGRVTAQRAPRSSQIEAHSSIRKW